MENRERGPGRVGKKRYCATMLGKPVWSLKEKDEKKIQCRKENKRKRGQTTGPNLANRKKGGETDKAGHETAQFEMNG